MNNIPDLIALQDAVDLRKPDTIFRFASAVAIMNGQLLLAGPEHDLDPSPARCAKCGEIAEDECTLCGFEYCFAHLLPDDHYCTEDDDPEERLRIKAEGQDADDACSEPENERV